MSAEWYHTDDENDDVATAPRLWRPLDRHLGGFDLDPAAGCEPTPIADERYTEADDGLSRPWFGTVWLNPPFSQKADWYGRLAAQYQRGAVERAAAVATADSSADWFHESFSTADTIAFLDGRDWFLGNGSSPSFATVVGLWGATPEAVAWGRSKGTVAHFEAPERTQLDEWGDE